jgi:Tol biopolymer transport system component
MYLNREEWKDAIQYRQNKLYEQSRIFRVDINQNNPPLTLERNIVKNVSFLIGELLFVPFEEKLLMTSVSSLIEDLQDFEIYSIDLRNISSSSPLVRLTDNEVIEHDLQLSVDGIHILYQTRSLGSSRRKFNNSQARLCSLNLIDGQS